MYKRQIEQARDAVWSVGGKDEGLRFDLARAFADVIARNNPKFQCARFFKECGINNLQQHLIDEGAVGWYAMVEALTHEAKR